MTNELPSDSERKAQLVRERALKDFFDNSIWESRFNSSDKSLGKHNNLEGHELLINNLTAIVSIVVNDQIRTKGMAEVISGTSETFRDILESTEHRLQSVRVGVMIAQRLRETEFGFDGYNHFPLLSQRGQIVYESLVDEKTDPEMYRLSQASEEGSVIDRARTPMTITTQERADILLGGFAYCLSRDWPGWAIDRVLPEIAWTLDLPERVIFEKYMNIILSMRKKIASIDDLSPIPGSRSQSSAHWDDGRTSYAQTVMPEMAPAQYVSEVDSAMKIHGYLWDDIGSEYVYIGDN